MTPIGAAFVISFNTSLTLGWIYVIFMAMALAYNPRASTSYLYATELLPKSKKMIFGSALFGIDGLFTIFSAYFFFVVRDQNAMMAILGTACLLSVITFYFFLPDSPSFLLLTG